LRRGTQSLQRLRISSRAMSSQPLTAPDFNSWRYGPKPVAPKDSPLRSHEDDLPSLPVPDLNKTVARALNSAEAISYHEDWVETLKERAGYFLNDPEEGQMLQKRLLEKAAEARNWLAKDWDQLAYMRYRDSVVCNVSYYYGFSKLPQGPAGSNTSEDDPAYVAATIVYYAAHYRDKIISGQIEPDQAGGAKQDMGAFQWLFNACRIPYPEEDYSLKIPENDSRGDHVVVIRRNHFYKVPIVGKDGKRATLDQLHQAFKEVYAQSRKTEKTQKRKPPAVGNFTAADRDHWATARAGLMANEVNVKTLEAIEQSIAVVCLDRAKPANGEELSRHLFHGQDTDSPSWWDKPMQWCIYDNGESGIRGEHSVMDGTPTARMNNEMTLDLMQNKLPSLSDPSSEAIEVSPLSWKLGDAGREDLDKATEQLKENIGDNELHYLFFDTYGKEQIKKHKCSPDGWVQMVMQLAYAYTHEGKVAATYESASVRRFHLGRTETVRVCSKASRAWVESMMDNTHTNDQRRDLFRKAVAQHGADMKEASAAQGIDRHLLGLKLCVREDEEVPHFLTDPLLANSSYWTMSTSQVYGRYFPVYGWGCVVPEGYGIPYMIQPESLLFTVTHRKGSKGDELIANLKRAANELMALMEDSPKEEAKAKL